MDANEYQRLAARTLWDAPERRLTDEETMIVWNALGLVGEAGEVAELIKKGIFHQHGLDHERITKELGDVVWYVSALCSKLGLRLADIMEGNINKLRQRYPEGFSIEASKGRSMTE